MSTNLTPSSPHRDSAPRPAPSHQSDADALLLDFLRERDAECPVCRYNLRSQSTNRCPECGVRIDLRVGSPDLRTHMLIAAFAPILMILGVTAFLIVARIWYGRPPGGGQALFNGAVACGLVNMIPGALLYARRTRFLAAPAALQNRIVFALCAYNALAFSLICFAIFR